MADRFADMFVPLKVDPRDDGPFVGDERSILLGLLSWQRETLELKCSGLSPHDLASRSLAPSKLSLLGLVRHLTDVERGWMRIRFGREQVSPLYPNPDEDFDGAVGERNAVSQAFEDWSVEIDFTHWFVESASDLDATIDDPWRGQLSLRWVLGHLVEEYARHNGHADILRERIDGAVGQ